MHFTPKSPLNTATKTRWLLGETTRDRENKRRISVVWWPKMKRFVAISPLTSLLSSHTHMIVVVIGARRHVSPQTWQWSKRMACCYRAFRQNVSFWPPTFTQTASVTAPALESCTAIVRESPTVLTTQKLRRVWQNPNRWNTTGKRLARLGHIHLFLWNTWFYSYIEQGSRKDDWSACNLENYLRLDLCKMFPCVMIYHYPFK